MSSKYRNREDPYVADVLNRFVGQTGLSYAGLAEVISCNPSEISRINLGYRPYAPILARLYILSGNKVFAPKDAHEKNVLQKEQAYLPKSMRAYMESTLDEEERVQSILTDTCVELGISMADLKAIVSRIFSDENIDTVGEKKPKFKSLAGKFDEEELLNAQLLLDELTRIFNKLVEVKDASRRARVGRRLAGKVDEFYLAVYHSREAVPSAAAERIAQLRETFGKRTRDLLSRKGPAHE